MKEKKIKTSVYGAVIILLLAGLVFSILSSITFGNADISIKEVYSVIFMSCSISTACLPMLPEPSMT